MIAQKKDWRKRKEDVQRTKQPEKTGRSAGTTMLHGNQSRTKERKRKRSEMKEEAEAAEGDDRDKDPDYDPEEDAGDQSSQDPTYIPSKKELKKADEEGDK